jgi:AcrR family transcriptional regulator
MTYILAVNGMTYIMQKHDEIDANEVRRCRGRPQVRRDDETRQVIYEAARNEFAAGGHAATSIGAVARRAGVSTKTLYRLIPNKAALLKSMVSDRLDRLVSELNLRAADHTDIQEALSEALMVCADLALDGEVIALQRMVLQEPGKCCENAGMYYTNGIERARGARGLAASAADAWVDRARPHRRGRRHAAGHGCRRAAARRDVRQPAATVALPDRSPNAYLCGFILAGLPNQAICLVRKLNRRRIRTTHLAWQGTLDIQ